MDPRRRPPSTSYETDKSTTVTGAYDGTSDDHAHHRTSDETNTAQQTPYNTNTANGISTSYPYESNSNQHYATNDTTRESRPRTGFQSVSISRPGTARPGTAATSRPRTGYSTYGVENQEIICAVCESRGVAPSVGLAFVNIDTTEAVLCQLNDTQTYVRTIHKLAVFNPSTVLVISSSANPESKLFSILRDNAFVGDYGIMLMERKYWAETAGLDYIQYHAFRQDLESLKTAITGNYYAVCSFSAALKFTELGLLKRFPASSLRIKYEPSEGSMMIDLATIQSLELVQNLHDPKSPSCLFGLVNNTLTPMGARLLRSNILQPVTDSETLGKRYDAVEELSTKEDMFFSVRKALKPFLDADKILTALIIIPTEASVEMVEQSVNNVIMLKQIMKLVAPVFEALAGSRSEMLQTIQSICALENIDEIQTLIDNVINEDIGYASKPLDRRNQRTYAVKSGVNGLLDVARQTYKESTDDMYSHIQDLKNEHNLPLVTSFEGKRQFFLRLRAEDVENGTLPAVFINVFKNKGMIECQTLEMVQRNQKIRDAHTEALLMSNEQVRNLIDEVRVLMAPLFKICESVAMLDMLSCFATAVAAQDYVRPTITSSSGTLAVRAGRHPIKEKLHSSANIRYIPNDIYATPQTRFQIITGCNMSGKSTYIRTVALVTIMAQIGSFVPATHASFPLIRQLFARISLDDNIESNVSTFAAEMREAAFILRNIDSHSLAIIDELGRGTSSRDGMTIALAISEALISSRALVFFATHFHSLSHILSERAGVLNLHLASSNPSTQHIEMHYRISQGTLPAHILSHYGIQIAKVLPFPPDVLTHAETVSETLGQIARSKKRASSGLVNARRRKLLLNLKEHLIQAREGNMNDEDLKIWLEDLQKEFVVRMAALDAELAAAKAQVDDDENGGDDGMTTISTETGTTRTFIRDVDKRDSTSQSTMKPGRTEALQPRTFIHPDGTEGVDLTGLQDSTGESVAGTTTTTSRRQELMTTTS